MHTTTIKVRGYHLDGYGHVNNARYLELLEEARWRFMEDSGDLYGLISANGLAMVVINVNISYRAQAVLHDVLHIDTQISELRSREGTARQVIRLARGGIATRADVRFVFVDLNNGVVARIGGELRERLAALLPAGS